MFSRRSRKPLRSLASRNSAAPGGRSRGRPPADGARVHPGPSGASPGARHRPGWRFWHGLRSEGETGERQREVPALSGWRHGEQLQGVERLLGEDGGRGIRFLPPESLTRSTRAAGPPHSQSRRSEQRAAKNSQVRLGFVGASQEGRQGPGGTPPVQPWFPEVSRPSESPDLLSSPQKWPVQGRPGHHDGPRVSLRPHTQACVCAPHTEPRGDGALPASSSRGPQSPRAPRCLDFTGSVRPRGGLRLLCSPETGLVRRTRLSSSRRVTEVQGLQPPKCYVLCNTVISAYSCLLIFLKNSPPPHNMDN